MFMSSEQSSLQLDFRNNPSVLGMIVDLMADGLFTVDSEARFIAWNHGAEQITGYSAEDVVGQPCRILEGPNCKGFGKLAEMLKAEMPGPEGICNQECKVLSKDGREVYIHGNVRIIRDDQGRAIGAVGSFTDVTSLVLANEKIALLERQTGQRNALEKLVGKSSLMQEVFRKIQLAADSDVTVFISGESGTGKELAAQAVHALSVRSEKPFIAVNCSAIPETLLESELFGHVKGAFTGATKDKVGVFQAADHGTLFLDEIGDVSPLLQLKLLRTLQEREIRRVGDDKPIPVNVRLITATNRDLMDLIRQGEYREDFYYRIHVFEIAMPPLRERREDIPLLVEHFIQELSQSHRKNVTGIAKDALARLRDYEWPGNVRELRNAMEHAFVTVSGETISLLDLPTDIRESTRVRQTPLRRQAAKKPMPLPRLTDKQKEEKLQIEQALRQTGGNKTEAAKLLATSRVTLWKKIRKYGIET